MDKQALAQARTALETAWSDKPAQTDETQFKTISLPLRPMQLRTMLGSSFGMPIRYVNDPTTATEILGFGSILQYEVISDLADMSRATKVNEAAVFIGGFPFFDGVKLTDEWVAFNEGHFVLPRFTIVNSEQKSHLLINYLLSEQRVVNLPGKLMDQLQVLWRQSSASPSKPLPRSISFVPEKVSWLNTTQQIIDGLDADDSKVVMARKKILHFQHSVEPQVIAQNASVASHSFQCYLQPTTDTAFYVNSPEALFSYAHGSITVKAIAGTRAIEPGMSVEETIEGLKNSPKDNHEQQIVCDFVIKAINELCSSYKTDFHQQPLVLNHLIHLASSYTGRLKQGSSLADVLKRLHPTPAVGGFPREKSLKAIKNHEQIQRGLYAGPVGYITKQSALFVVGIRSALFHKRDIHIYGGAGIVRGSTPEAEWQETGNKIESIQRLLGLKQ